MLYVALRGLFLGLTSILAFILLQGSAPATFAQTGSGTTVSLHVRNGGQILYQGNVTLPSAPVSIVDNQGVTRSVDGRSTLSALHHADTLSTSFHITDLVYYPSFGSFYVNCIQAGINNCGHWQYVVNDTYPFVGIDQKILSNGDDVYFFFGQSNRLTLSASAVVAGESFTAMTEEYLYKTNSFAPRPGVTVGVTQTNPNDPWNPIVLTTAAVNVSGRATLTVNTTGSYQVGVAEDFYYPTVPLQVVAPGSGGGGGKELASTSVSTTSSTSAATTNKPIGGIPSDAGVNENAKKLKDFLFSHQKESGGFENPLVTDWIAIALGKDEGSAEARVKLQAHLSSNPDGVFFTTDFERRAMAVMAMGINPYYGAKVNYIAKILKTFHGGQFGDEKLINDDIFALFPVIRAGVPVRSYRIKKTVDTILKKQGADGSWENPDLTAAAVQALLLANNDKRINDAVRLGRDYLKKGQASDGRIGMNSFSSSWAAQALTGTGSTLSDQTAADKSLSYVQSKVQSDGGIKDGEDSVFNRLWGTAYALTAERGKHWGDLLHSFKPSARKSP